MGEEPTPRSASQNHPGAKRGQEEVLSNAINRPRAKKGSDTEQIIEQAYGNLEAKNSKGVSTSGAVNAAQLWVATAGGRERASSFRPCPPTRGLEPLKRTVTRTLWNMPCY